MADLLLDPPETIEEVDVSQLVTEDDTPVDNLPSEKNQRLLTSPLYASSYLERPFVAAANVGIYRAMRVPVIVPDTFLSLGVAVAETFWEKKNRAYLLWEFGKAPEVVIEIVSNKKGNELTSRLQEYAKLGAWYYAVYDPHNFVQAEKLVVYELIRGRYVRKQDCVLEDVELCLVLWNGVFEDTHSEWLRWTDMDGNLILTGQEQAIAEQQRADRADERATHENRRANEAEIRAAQATREAEIQRERAERLAAKLQALGIDPNSI